MQFESVAGISLGTATVDSSGVLNETIIVPASAPTSGKVLIRGSGYGANGGLRLVLGTWIMGSSLDDDIDADGIPEACDNCPSSNNPTQSDIDGDGLGDACDACPEDRNNDLDGNEICDNLESCVATENANVDGKVKTPSWAGSACVSHSSK